MGTEVQDQRLFIDGTKQRVNHLVANGVWEGLDLTRCVDWFRQFEEADCGLLGACLLDNLAYRSKDQVIALFKAALTCNQLLSGEYDSDLAIVEALQGRQDSGIRLIPVISPDQPPTKSGPYMLRLLSRDLRIQDRWMLWASELSSLPEGVNTILVVDDFCGSGQQFVNRFLKMPEVTAFRRERSECRFVYVAAAAHSVGVDAIRLADANIEVVAGETLTPDHHFFEGTILEQYQNDGLKDTLIAQHKTMVSKLSLGRALGEFGFGSLGLTYAFAHGTPNNTLPLLWHDNTDCWTSLLDR